MADDDLHDQISSLEAQIEEFTEVTESCRKVILVSKVAVAAGGIWLLAFTFGAIRFDPMVMMGAISAVIGGIVVFGSNTSTSKQAAAAIKAAEALRAELIGKINLRLVGEAEGKRTDCLGANRT
jgi:cell division septum initiation protein DivIVA